MLRLYSDRGSHFWVTSRPVKVDSERLTQVGRALRELGIRLIPAYSPQARGRMERNFRTWQGRLPQELRLAGITKVCPFFCVNGQVLFLGMGCRGRGSFPPSPAHLCRSVGVVTRQSAPTPASAPATEC